MIVVNLEGYSGCGRPADFVHVSPTATGVTVTLRSPLSDALEALPPTRHAYEAACRALAHWREEARRLGEVSGEPPRPMATRDGG